MKKLTAKNKTCNIPVPHITNREELHKTYGGKIYPSDFNTCYSGPRNLSGPSISARIVAELNWERNLRKAKEEHTWTNNIRW